MEGPEMIGIPDGDELFTGEVPSDSTTEDHKIDQSWVNFATAVKPTGGKDARNKKKE